MDKKGSVIAQVYTSEARLPVENANVTFFKSGSENEALANRITDKSGKTAEVDIETPELKLSLSPGDITPFARVDIKITHPEFYGILIREAQVFSDTQTLQPAELIPLEEKDGGSSVTETVSVTPQNL